MENVEQMKSRLLELEEKLAEFNSQIIERSEASLTQEFEDEYRQIQDEYETLSNALKDLEPKPESFFNKVSLSLFFYFLVMTLLVFPLTINLIAQEIVLAFLEMEFIQNFTKLQLQTIVVLAYLIYPLGLLIVNTLIRLIFVRSKENKKLYFVWSLIFGGILLLGTILGFVELVLPIFK